MQVLIIPTSSDPYLADIEANRATFQKIVGGSTQFIGIDDRTHAYINEAGKSLQLPINPRAIRFCREFEVGLMEDDYVVGSMLILGTPDEESSQYDVGEEAVPEHIVEHFFPKT